MVAGDRGAAGAVVEASEAEAASAVLAEAVPAAAERAEVGKERNGIG